ncbi:hypothetical protein [Escherichia coli]|uniref:hypothetical protein n=1 Tax=Escherichia coli TaxID=562 RepID=UPI0013D24E05
MYCATGATAVQLGAVVPGRPEMPVQVLRVPIWMGDWLGPTVTTAAVDVDVPARL